jgi:orotate phosphoribosyltransferase
MVLTYDKRQALWEWCRQFLDCEALYRADETHPRLLAKTGGKSLWQFYTMRATMNSQFAHAIGLLFWDIMLPVYQKRVFQVCACAPSGQPIGLAISAAARRLKIPLNLFIARRDAKRTGVDNWFDGRVLPDVPVMIVDDMAASAPFIRQASARIQAKLGVPLHYNYFTVINKVGRLRKHSQHTEAYPDNQLIALFTINNIAQTSDKFMARYGRPAGFSGLIK